MWVIFILGMFGFGFLTLISFYFGNKILNKIKKDNLNFQQELKKYEYKEEKEEEK